MSGSKDDCPGRTILRVRVKVPLAMLASASFLASCVFDSSGLPAATGAADSAPTADGQPARDARARDFAMFTGNETELWRLDPTTLEASFVGAFTGSVEATFRCGGIALDSAGTLYALSVGPPSRLYVVDKTTASLSKALDLGNTDNTWGSTIVPIGMFATTERLMIGGPAGQLMSVDLVTGNTVDIGSFGGGWGVSGDLAWVDGVGLMGTVDNGVGNDMLATISLSTGAVTIVGDTGRSNVYGLTSTDGKVWGLTGSNEIFEMNTSDASEISSISGPSAWTIAAP